MQYAKPSIVSLGVASRIIQGSGNKAQQIAFDADGVNLPRSTGSAYDLDE